MNYIGKTFQIILGVLLALYVALIFALDNSRVQEFIADVAEEKLSETLGSKVEIGRVAIGLFNAVELHEVTLYDQADEKMLHSKLIYGKVQSLPLLKGKVAIRNISILDGDIVLYKETKDGAPNFKFVIDAFKSDTKKKKPLDITINSLLLRRCRLAYDDRYVALPESYRTSADGLPVRPFSAHHILASDIDANISLKHLTDNDVNLRIRQLKFKEQSGLMVQDLRAHIVADRQHADISDFYVRLPQSHISQKLISADYDFKDAATFKKTLTLKGELHDAVVATSDVVHFVPQLAAFNEILHISSAFDIQPNKAALSKLRINTEDNNLSLLSNITVRAGENKKFGCDIDITECEVKQQLVESVFANVLHKELPAPLSALGDIALEGTARYDRELKQGVFLEGVSMKDFVHNADLKTRIKSDVGSFDTQLSVEGQRIETTISSADFNAAQLASNDKLPSLVDFVMSGKTTLSNQPMGSLPFGIAQGQADITLNSVKLGETLHKNIKAAVNFDGKAAQADVTADNAMAKFNTSVSAVLDATRPFGALPHDIVASFDVEHLSPVLLNLTNRYGNGVFAFKGNSQITSADINNLNAQVAISDFTLTGDGNAPYTLDRLNITATPASQGTHITLRSDFADLDYTGPVEPQQVKKFLRNVTQNIQQGMYDDDLATESVSSVANDNERINLAMLVKKGDFLNRVVGTSIDYSGTIHAFGSATPDGRQLTLTVEAPHLSFGKFTLDNLSVYARNRNGAFNLLGKVNKKLQNGDIQAELTAVNRDGKILTDIEWDETSQHKFYGQLCTSTSIDIPENEAGSVQKKAFGFNTTFTPSSICIGDTLWQVAKSNVDFHNQRVAIRNFGISNGRQSLTINGNYDKNSQDTIVVHINQLNLEYALAFARINVVDFAGHATGNIFVRQLPNGNPWAKANVFIPDFKFNNADFGAADVTLGWDHANRDITIKGLIREDGIGYTRVNGYVDPINKDLDLRTESKNTQLAFLNKYTADIFSDVSGRATGNCRIYGGFKSIEFSGHEVADAQATIPVTGVTYRIKDADVDIVPDAFNVKSATITDLYAGTGVASGTLSHEHIQNMRYDFNLTGSNLRLYDKPRELDMPFYATATGSGDVHIYGAPGKMNADINIATVPGSELTYILDSPDADVSQLLTLHDEKATEQTETIEVTTTPAETTTVVPTTDINLYFEVDVDDKSRLSLITDDKSGDAINVYGSGPIQATYHNKSGFRMYGTYNIDRGTYDLNIPSLAQRKRFDILSGGKVLFSGDPTEAEVNVKAQYVVNSASLADLNIGSGFANNTTRVNCLVNLFGEVANMQFDLNFELPNCSEDEQQMVRNLIASDEDRTMQVLYLLGVGRFYAYNYSANDVGQSQSVLMMNSLLSSTLSSQLNNIISNAVGSNNWSFGTNISTGQMGWSDMEVEGLVSSRLLNNRLLLNGNFGYSERQAATTNFVGDFDMQYLITPKGTVSVKAYSETNDRYFTKSSLTTQGVGIQLKKDFTRLSSLFRRKKASNDTPKKK